MFQNPENIRFGGGAEGSTIHPVTMAMLLLAIALTFLLPRKYLVIPYLVTTIMAPFGQQLYVAGVHLFVTRILIVFVWMRFAFSKKTEFVSGGLTGIDRIFIWWAALRAVATCLSFMEVGAVINQVAFCWDTLGGFFIYRHLIRDDEDIARVLKTLSVIVMILALAMSYEQIVGRNLFGYIGGHLAPFLRDDKIRSIGPFTGPIPAGTFGATLLCLFLWLWKSGRSDALAIAGCVGSAVMVYTSSSSTPLMTFPAGLLAICFWPLRRQMRIVRWSFATILIVLHLSMKAPVWMLINHINLVGGNSSYHRAMLIDAFVRHWNEWWLVGVQSTAGWGWDMWDQANQYAAEGESGGLATFVCFIMLISRCCGRLGTARRLAGGSTKLEWSFWLLGATMFSHIVAFFGISFSDQSIQGWQVLIAIICAATAPMFAAKAVAGVQAVATVGDSMPNPLSAPVVVATGRHIWFNPDRKSGLNAAREMGTGGARAPFQFFGNSPGGPNERWRSRHPADSSWIQAPAGDVEK